MRLTDEAMARRCGRRRARFTSLGPGKLAVVLLAAMLSAGTGAQGGQLAYIANGAGSVSVLDAETDEVMKTIPLPVQTSQSGVALLLSTSAHRLFALVTETLTVDGTPVPRASLTAIDTTRHRIVATRDLPQGWPGTIQLSVPISFKEPLALSADGTRLYVSSFGDLASLSGRVLLSTLDPRDLSPLAAEPLLLSTPPLVPDPASVMSSPTLSVNRGRVYQVTPQGTLAVSDATSGAVVSEIPLPADALQGRSSVTPLLAPNEDTLLVADVLVALDSNQIVGRLLDLLAFSGDPFFSADGTRLLVLANAPLVVPPGCVPPTCVPPPSGIDLFAFDVPTGRIVARVPTGTFSVEPIIAASLDGGRVAFVLRPQTSACRKNCLSRPQELVVVGVPEGMVIGRERIAESLGILARSPDGRRIFLQDVTGGRGRLLRRGRVGQLILSAGPVESQLLEVDLAEGRVQRRADAEGFAAGILPQFFSAQQDLSRAAALTRDGGKLYVIGTEGPLGAPEVRALSASSDRLDTVVEKGAIPRQIVLGDPCDSAEGCFCNDDADCHDENDCTIDTCEQARRCRNQPLPCVDGIRCLFDDRRDAGCQDPAQRRSSKRARQGVSAAARALQGGDVARARALLDGSRDEVKRLLGGVLRRTNTPNANSRFSRDPQCNQFLFERQLRLLRSLRDVTGDLDTCEAVAR